MKKGKRIFLYFLVSFLIAVFSTLFGAFFYSFNFFDSSSNFFYDFLNGRFVFKGDVGVSDDVVIVLLDEDSLELFGSKGEIPRDLIAQGIEYIVSDGARCVALDFSLAEGDRSSVDNDRVLRGVDSFSENGQCSVVFPFELSDFENKNSVFMNFSIKGVKNKGALRDYRSVLSPHSVYCEDNFNFGFINKLSCENGIVREYEPFARVGSMVYPSIGAAPFLLCGYDVKSVYTENGRFFLKFYSDSFFKKISFSEVLNSGYGNRSLPVGLFKDCVVFIGEDYNGRDSFEFINSEIDATAFVNMVKGDYLRELPFDVFLASIFLFSFLLSFLVFIFIRYRSSLYFFILFFLLICFLGGFIFLEFDVMTNLPSCLISIFIAFFISVICDFFIFGRKRRAVYFSNRGFLRRRYLSKFLRSDFNQDFLDKKVSVMSIEVLGFSKLLEDVGKKEAFRILNFYLNGLRKLIVKKGGFIYRFSSKEIFVVFGFPCDVKDGSSVCVDCAVECCDFAEFFKNDYGLSLCVGLSFGDLMASNFYSGSNYNLELVGSVMEEVSLLRNLNKFFGTSIIADFNIFMSSLNREDFIYGGKVLFSALGEVKKVYFFNEFSSDYIALFKKMLRSLDLKDIASLNACIKSFEVIDGEFGPAKFYMEQLDNNSSFISDGFSRVE